MNTTGNEGCQGSCTQCDCQTRLKNQAETIEFLQRENNRLSAMLTFFRLVTPPNVLNKVDLLSYHIALED